MNEQDIKMTIAHEIHNFKEYGALQLKRSPELSIAS
jgi:hypothetical protein